MVAGFGQNAAPRFLLVVGQTLSYYRVLEELGRGGMGVVYKATDTRLDRDVALKLLPEEASTDREALERFLREARTTAALNHPHICTIHNIDEHDGRRFIVMELLKGKTLKEVIAEGPLTIQNLIRVGSHIADALAATHAKGVVHRDIKPGNIFVTEQGIAKILDFGIAKLLGRESDALTTRTLRVPPTAEEFHTSPGVAVGTVAYMSPEQVRGEDADARSDLFSLGAVLYEAATGQRAFWGSTAAMLVEAILMRAPTRPTRLNPKVPLELERIIGKALEKDSAVRYQTASDLLADLRRLQRDQASDGATLVGFALPPTRWQTDRVRTTTPTRSVEPGRSVRTLAVLPLANASGDPETEYLSDGITESIINSLSPLKKLRVMAWSTVVRFKGHEGDARAIGERLNVGAVLTGRVMHRDHELIIAAELVDVTTGAQIWGRRYGRTLSDVFEVQEEIATEISEKLRLRLTGEDRKRLLRRHTGSTEAYQLYLKGRWFWNQRGPGLMKAIPLFEQALQEDPYYALAYSGLADSYSLLGFYGRFPPHEVFPRAKAAAVKALELDDTLAEAHTSLGFILLFFDRDKAGAARAFRRALALKHDYPPAHMWYAAYFFMIGEPERAIEEDRRALATDFLSFFTNAHYGWVLVSARRSEAAITQLRTALELNPHFFVTHWLLGQAYLLRGQAAEALACFTKAVELSQRDSRMLAWQAYALATEGEDEQARKVKTELLRRSVETYVPPSSLAYLSMGLGETGEAYNWLERAYEDRDVWLPYIYVDSVFDSIRTEPRFQDLLRRLGLPTSQDSSHQGRTPDPAQKHQGEKVPR